MLKKKKLAKKKIAAGDDPFWGNTKNLLRRGAVTPIVSNFMIPTIFGGDTAIVAQSWAEDEEVASPLSAEDNQHLARVAQYFSVRENARAAKAHYLESLKGFLFSLAEENDLDPDLLEELEENSASQSFSEMAYRLGYPKITDAEQNPLRLLAELPLPLYITTSPHDFLEVALSRANPPKAPVSEIFYWDDTLHYIPSIYDEEPAYQPTVERPLVYHLYGLDKYSESLILTEDDYLDFLITVTSSEVRHFDQQRGIPSSILKALAGTSLLLLGYTIYNWEFRVLFRGIIRAMDDSRGNNRNVAEGISMQIKPGQEFSDPTKVKTYLDKYFEKSNFKVYWGTAEHCAQDLWRLWQE